MLMTAGASSAQQPGVLAELVVSDRGSWAPGTVQAMTTAQSITRACFCPVTGVSISSQQDGGNIEGVRPLLLLCAQLQVLDMKQLSSMQLRITPEPFCHTDGRSHFQWFSFQVAGARHQPLAWTIVNAGEVSRQLREHTDRRSRAPVKGHREMVCQCSDSSSLSRASTYDRKGDQQWWQNLVHRPSLSLPLAPYLPSARVPTQYDQGSGALTVTHTPDHSLVHYAYFAPYSWERHTQLVARTQLHPEVTHRVIGHTLEGRPLDLLQVGSEGEGKKKVWVIARQHPGETMAEFFMEGLLQRLTDCSDPVAHALLTGCVFYTIPNMCPDGSVRGHLRTNAAGANLNRHWAGPDPQLVPEVHATLAAMDQSGVDLLLDVHGDEGLPYVFVAGNNGIPGWSPRLEALQQEFCAAFCAASPDFQTRYGYPTDPAGKANLRLASKQVGQRFDALSLTLEMPFKDTANAPRSETGWSPQRSAALGAAILGAVMQVMPKLR
ncbi:hypothetical protein QJQ45_023235 [Haematococcus lacustris]|nr:hypothetical protein QJQ45_023235 [Haematococcus lacustris]